MRKLLIAMRKLPIVVLLMVMPLVASADQAAKQLADLLGSIKTFQAVFTQYVVDQRGTNLQDTAGYVRAKRPNQFIWETQAPLAQHIVSDGKQLWVYDPDLEQVTIRALDEQVQNTPALLLSGNIDNLAASYKIKQEVQAQGVRVFSLVPLGADSLFEELRLTFHDKDLAEMRLRDSLGQRTVLNFAKITVNEEIPDSAFSFQMPEGVDVFHDQ
jgi:outer membrane lipoprotein carrier protein